MNTAARVAVRLGIEHGMTMVGIEGGIPGLIDGDVRDLTWEAVEGWVGEGGAELGTRRTMPTVEQLYAIGRRIEKLELDALVFIGGYNAYLTADLMVGERDRFPAFDLPIVCIPASIDNNLPGSELSIGSDTALNNAVWALDGIKQSAMASTRCFVAESMGRKCGYLTLLSGIASGAERVYLHEEGVTLDRLQEDVEAMKTAFASGKRLFLTIRNERANEHYTTDFMSRLFEEEGHDLFDVRQAVLGHLQQGGNPTAFDRILATRLVRYAMDGLAEQLATGDISARYVGLTEGHMGSWPIDRMMDHVDAANRRPKEQWWMQLRPIISAVSDREAVAGEVPIPVLREEPVED